MKSWITRPRVALSIAAIAVASGAALAQAPAQPAAPPQRILVSITQLKPDMVLTWEDVTKNEMIPAQKKVGIPWRQTLGSGVSSQQFVRVTIVPLTNYAELDKPAILTRATSADANANYNAKIRQTIDGSRNVIAALRADLSIVSAAATMQPLQVVQTLQLLPGKGNDFTASMIQDFLPAYRKAGVKDYWVYATNQGGPGGEFVLVRPIASYAELDKPGLLQQAGVAQDALERINARRNAMLSGGVKTEVFRFIPELSYGMPTSVRQTN